MAAETAYRLAIGEDGIEIAVTALKEIAQDTGSPDRLAAAQTLLKYGLSFVDAFGNVVAG